MILICDECDNKQCEIDLKYGNESTMFCGYCAITDKNVIYMPIALHSNCKYN